MSEMPEWYERAKRDLEDTLRLYRADGMEPGPRHPLTMLNRSLCALKVAVEALDKIHTWGRTGGFAHGVTDEALAAIWGKEDEE